MPNRLLLVIHGEIAAGGSWQMFEAWACVCAFHISPHSWVQLGAVDCVPLVFLVEEITYLQT